jgi:diguanylate cyclase (GGDEF)-like protein
LEDERKQVRQLTALHDVAMLATEADNQDQLIEQVTNIIGQNLFPDNVGILLLDQEQQVLRAHPSYRFHSTEKREISDVQLGIGVSGEVARTGQSQRIGNVRRIQNYLDMDDRTISELCVPIKFKEQVLGVINAESTKRDAFTEDDERLLVTLAGQLATALEQLRKADDERKWLGRLAHANALIYSIAQITTQIERSLTTDAIVQTLGTELENINLTCIMAVYDQDRKTFTINYTSLPPHFLEIVETGLGYPLIHYTFPHHKLNTILNTEDMLRPSVISDPEEEIEALFTDINKHGVLPLLEKIGVTRGIEPLRLPLVFEENLLGVLWVWGKDITRSDLPIMSIFAKQIGISLERARLFQEVQSLALTDPLTDLQNRRSIFELGKIEFSRAERMNRPFCCMMLDIDHFKQVNDQYGHQIGDFVLREFARCCQTSVRDVDLVGRYGGEELIILLPETDRDTAVQVAERLRLSISQERIKIDAHEIRVTVSIGVAAKDENTQHFEALIARADQALYIAKHKGRNRVAISV